MDFWDHLTFATTLAIRDYYREKEKQKKKLEEFRMQCGSEIAAEASKFYNLAQKLTEQAKIRIVPKEFTDGTMLFPMYVFNRVLALQRNRVTKSQDKLLSTYRATMMAVVKPSPTMSAVNEIMRIDDKGVGAFWKIFFKVLYLTPNDEHVLTEISECFTNIAVRFAFLGGVDIKLTEPMCNAFIRALHIQSIACRRLPEEDIDFIGETHFLEHKDRMYRIASTLIEADNAKADLAPDEVMPIFFASCLKKLVDRSSRSAGDRADILTYALKCCKITLDFTPRDVYFSGTELESIKHLLDTLYMEFSGIILIMGQKTGRNEDALSFARELGNFLIGIEKELADKYPFSGFGDHASDIASDVVKQAIKMLG